MGFLAVMFIPGFKGMLVNLGYVVAGLIVLAGLVAIGVLLIRRSAPVSYGATSNPRVTLETIAPTPVVSPNISPVATPKPKSVAKVDVAQLRAIDWYQFEKLVAATYRKLGFTVQRRGGAHADGGIDLLIRKDSETSAVRT